MICQSCGVEAATKKVAFYQNIGALVMRFRKHIKGNLCKSCIHKYFWEFTLVNLTLGWWGMISMILTPFLIVNNVARYVMCLGMEPVPPGATVPVLTPEAVARLNPFATQMFNQIKQGEALERVTKDFASRVGVTPGVVVLYLRAAMRRPQPAKRMSPPAQKQL